MIVSYELPLYSVAEPTANSSFEPNCCQPKLRANLLPNTVGRHSWKNETTTCLLTPLFTYTNKRTTACMPLHAAVVLYIVLLASLCAGKLMQKLLMYASVARHHVANAKMIRLSQRICHFAARLFDHQHASCQVPAVQTDFPKTA